MIVSQAVKKEQIQRRLNLKTAEEAFSREIVRGTNCSPFEAEIIVEKALEAFAEANGRKAKCCVTVNWCSTRWASKHTRDVPWIDAQR